MATDLHDDILAAIKEHKRTDISQEMFQRYHGSPRFCYGVRVPDKRKIAKKFLKQHPEITSEELESVLTKLYSGKSFDEATIAGLILEFSPEFRTTMKLSLLEEWLDKLIGWAEVDTTCQSGFSAAEILARWKEWQQLLRRLAVSKNINKRRASLVLLVRAARETDDIRIWNQVIENIEKLKHEKEILITKAISWVLRSGVVHHGRKIAEYLEENAESLPKLAIRETRQKLITGKKNYAKRTPSHK